MFTLNTNTQPQTEESKNETWSFKGFADECQIELAPYTGADFSKMAFLFCGQGTMFRGAMAEFVKAAPIFQARFKELDQIAVQNGIEAPSTYVLGTEKDLPKEIETMQSALCLYTLQVAMFETLLSVGFYPEVLSSHSFGEFAQITASGVVPFGDMVRFLIERQKLLNTVDGKYVMFAVNNSAKLDLKALPFEVHIANVNTHFQTSFVCKESDYPEIRQHLKNQRIASVPVNVDFPFHTPWLSQVQAQLAEILSTLKMSFRSPIVPFVSSVTQKVINTQNYSSKEIQKILVEQMTTPVHFPNQLKAMQKLSTMHFFELAPQDVLSSFVEQVFESDDLDVKINSFRNHFKSGVNSKKSYDKLKSSKFFTALDGALKALTGYSIEHIQLEDRIREDLGIDSIKKAEIVFEIIDGLNQHQIVTPTNLSDLSTFGDILEYFETSKLASENAETKREAERITDFQPLRRTWKEKALTDFASTATPAVVRVDLSKPLSEVKFDSNKDSVLVFIAPPGYGQAEDFVAFSESWLKALKASNIQSSRWVLLHQASDFSFALEALLTTYAQEKQASFKSIWTGGLNLSDREIYLESIDFAISKVRYQNGVRSVRDFEKFEDVITKRNPPRHILAFGGLGGVGYQQLASLPDGQAYTLTIVGRKPVEEVGSVMASLEAKAKDVVYRSLDVSDATALQDFMSSIQMAPDLIIHSVGVEVSETLETAEVSELMKIVKAKANLALALEDYGRQNLPTHIVFNSSMVSEFGSRGQTSYAMTNALMNAIADRSQNICSLLWPGWSQTGVAAQSMNAKSMKLQGMSMMTPERGAEIFKQTLITSGSLCVLDMNSALDYAAIGQQRQEFGQLMKPASRDYSLFVVPGLTQSQLPYLKDHLIKKMCIFPASGSLSLMLFRAYLERGEIGQVENFQAHNFLVVGQESSGVTMEVIKNLPNRVGFQIKSHQLLSQGEIVFREPPSPSKIEPFTSDMTGVTDFDNNAAVYTGPGFELMKKSYANNTNQKLLVELDFLNTPKYFEIPFIDKIHKLIEISFSSPFAKVVISHKKFTLPKSVKSIAIHKEGLKGLKFYSVVENLRKEGAFFRCDVTTVNEFGVPALVIQDYRSLIVGDSKSAKSEGFRVTHATTEFQWASPNEWI